MGRSDSDGGGRSSRGSKRSKKRRRRRSSSSSSRESRRRRERSRSLSEERRSHRRRSPKKSKKSSDAVFGRKTGTLKDMFDVVSGFSKMTPAEQSKIRVRRALQMAEENKTEMSEEQLLDKVIDKSKDADIKSQIARHNKIINNDDKDDDSDGEFVPSHFRSKPSKRQQQHEERENVHELAMFGHSSTNASEQVTSMLSREEAMRRKEEEDEKALRKARMHVDFMQRDPSTLMADVFKLDEEQREKRWLNKLRSLKRACHLDGVELNQAAT